MNYIKVASVGELRPGSMKKITVENTPVLLANLEGTYYAMEDTCPHMGGSLSAGKLDGSNIVCPRHGSVFDVKTGKAVKNGKLLFITAKVHDLKSFPVHTEGSDVMLGID
jgi:3-phenylpropionate/trans-cinnamate dioxygenase ferredoxin subunit